MFKNLELSCIGSGLAKAAISTLIILVVFSLLSTFIAFGDGVESVILTATTCVSVVYGSAMAARDMRRNGWVAGLLVSAGYCIILFLASSIALGALAIAGIHMFRILVALIVGVIAGILGVNI